MALDAIYLSREELLILHERVILQYGGMEGIRDEGILDACLAQPKMFVFGVERFSTLIQKAAAYCFFIVRGHPFFDGNKRAGFVAALHFLRMNNVQVRFDQDEAYDVIVRVATSDIDVADVARMIASAVERARSTLDDEPAEGTVDHE